MNKIPPISLLSLDSWPEAKILVSNSTPSVQQFPFIGLQLQHYDFGASEAITTLGRGGSDLSATIIGAALGVPEVQVWKDVDGMQIF